MSLRLCRIAPLNEPLGPGTGSQEAQPDEGKLGWLQVIYKEELRWARPCFPFGEYTPPSDEWIRNNADRFSVWVACESTFSKFESEDHLVYLGFVPLEDGLDDMSSFPNKTIRRIGRWEVVFDNSATGASAELRYIGDPENPLETATTPAAPGATVLKITQAVGSESIRLEQFVAGKPTLPTPTFIEIDVVGNLTSTLGGAASITSFLNTTIESSVVDVLIKALTGITLDCPLGVKVGGPAATQPLVLGNILVTLLTTFLTGFNTHVHFSPFLGLPTLVPTVPLVIPWNTALSLFNTVT